MPRGLSGGVPILGHPRAGPPAPWYPPGMASEESRRRMERRRRQRARERAARESATQSAGVSGPSPDGSGPPPGPPAQSTPPAAPATTSSTPPADDGAGGSGDGALALSPEDAAKPSRAFIRAEFADPAVRVLVRQDIRRDPAARRFYWEHAEGKPVQRVEQIQVSAVVVARADGTSPAVAAVLAALVARASGGGEERETPPAVTD